jgi:hypothetical protein
MTTPYAVSTNKGSVSYNGYVNAPITGPLSTNQTPSQIPYHSYGTLTGLRPTPPQFLPCQMPVNAQMNTNARHQYLRTSVSTQELQRQIALGKSAASFGYVIKSTQRQVPVSSHTNYIPPVQSSLHLNTIKAKAIGKSGYKMGLPNSASIGTKAYNPCMIQIVQKKMRSSSCVAPAKKGAIQNTSLSNGRTCGWGSIVRSTY